MPDSSDSNLGMNSRWATLTIKQAKASPSFYKVKGSREKGRIKRESQRSPTKKKQDNKKAKARSVGLKSRIIIEKSYSRRSRSSSIWNHHYSSSKLEAERGKGKTRKKRTYVEIVGVFIAIDTELFLSFVEGLEEQFAAGLLHFVLWEQRR
jgi:hypothetical protein